MRTHSRLRLAIKQLGLIRENFLVSEGAQVSSDLPRLRVGFLLGTAIRDLIFALLLVTMDPRGAQGSMRMKKSFLHAGQPVQRGYWIANLAIVLFVFNLFILTGPIADRACGQQVSDAELARTANAQFDAGNWRDAFATAESLSYDTTRADLLNDLSQKRVESQQETRRQLKGFAGGVTAADFTNLIDLITNTVSPDSWQDTGQGLGTIQSYPAGVFVDPEGTLKKIKVDSNRLDGQLLRFRQSGWLGSNSGDWQVQSGLRMVSLTRLEKAVQSLAAQGKPIAESMQNLGGIYEIKYLMMYPETGDIVIAGPAGAWKPGPDNRPVNIETGQPVLQLDDLVVCLRNAWDDGGKFGCSITPRKANLAATKKFLATTKLKGNKWSAGVRSTLGKQDVEVFGIDPQTHAARVLVEADYRMKLLGMGLEETIPEVPSYFDRVKLAKDGSPPPMDVVRWWFTLNYDDVVTNADRTAFSFNGTGVKVLSETEFINDRGERIHTGTSHGPTKSFARDFTDHFDKLAKKYPVYRQLKNVFDLALVSSLICREDLTGKTHWHRTFFASPESGSSDLTYQVRKDRTATQVDTVLNEKILTVRKQSSRVKHRLIGVSGGISYDVDQILGNEYTLENKLDSEQSLASGVKNGAPDAQQKNWWWD